jgi:serine phosphatase RsbU (regulator of sigma subunit)
MQTIKPFLPYFLVLIISTALIVWLFPTVHPESGIYLPLDAPAITDHSRSVLKDLGIDYSGMRVTTTLHSNRDLVRQTEHMYGIEGANPLLRDSIPGYYWDVRWTKSENLTLSFGRRSSEARQAEQVAEFLRGDVHFQFDTRGKILEFESKVADSAKLASISVADAKVLAVRFLSKYSAIDPSMGDTSAFPSEKLIEQPNRTDHEFVWSSRSPVLHNPTKSTVRVAGDHVSRFSAEEEFPKEIDSLEARSAIGIGLVLIYVGIGIAMVIVAFRRFRSYEIGFRLAIIAGIVTGILYDIDTYLTTRSELGWELLIPLLMIPLFMGGALVLVWAVSESAVRESWKEKFISFDLISRGHFLHSRVGANVLRGIIAGFGALALWLVLAKIADGTFHLWVSYSDDAAFHPYDISFPLLYILANSFYSNIFMFAFLVLFVVSLLHKFISSPGVLIGVSAIGMAVLGFGHLYPIPAALVIESLVAAVSIWVFYRYDALAALFSVMTFSALPQTAGLFVAHNPAYTATAITLVGFCVVVLVLSITTLYRKKEVADFDEITPAFARHITERQRLQQELEIARSVQMSFLPKANPVTSKFDIASRCAPALEVGGDYYDFINLNDQRLGVAVGDVSGKGTQAAFFMTLTKGFLNALAHVSNSPSKILTQVNKLFYDSVERGMFISMVYGIFDTRANSLTLARAGHNPVIMRKSLATDVQVVNPMGLALGLDEGDTFSKSIQEVTIDFQPGDLFVFYTDGFPEAMNKTMEEFGEERLCKTVEKYSSGSAAEIMEGVFRDMKEFTGKAKQHDDMTIVVVKVV